MRITIDTEVITAYEVRNLVKLLCAMVCGAASQVEDLDKDTEKNPVDMSSAELSARVDALNAELYSRRIPTADNPATGADAAALNSDAHGELAHSGLGMPSFTATVQPHVEKIATVLNGADLFNIFGGAGGGAVSDDAAKSFAHEQLGEPFVAGTVTLDKAGIPWDSRIHSASKSINQTDGLWRQKRGVSPELVATVVGQLKQAQSVPPVGAIVVDNSISGDGDGPEPSDAAINEVLATVGMEIDTSQPATKIPPPPPVAATPSVPPPPTGDAPPADTGEIDSLPRLLKFITEQKLAGKINQAHVQAALTALGIEGPLPVLQSRPDLIPEMVKKLRAIGGL